MGYEAYDKAEKKHHEEVGRLNKIALKIIKSDHGDFVKYLAKAWLLAGESNVWIIKPAWSGIVTKYRLAEEAAG